MLIRWSPEAADELEDIVRHIRQDDHAAARRVAQMIYDGASSLETLPNRGRRGLRPTTRELVFPPYIVVYRVSGDIVEIIHVEHGAQDRKP